MNRQFSHHYEILPEAQKSIWPELARFKERFVLYGGTALALRIGHRQSVDFDFFSEAALEHRWVADNLPAADNTSILQSEPNTYTVLLQVDGGYVKLSFFGALDFGRIGEPQLTEDRVLLVAALEDLMATKVKVLMQRVEQKDYIDIAALIAHGIPLEEGLSGASLLFGKTFSPTECLRALQYFDEVSLTGLDASVKRSLKEAVNRVLSLKSLPELNKKSGSLGY